MSVIKLVNFRSTSYGWRINPSIIQTMIVPQPKLYPQWVELFIYWLAAMKLSVKPKSDSDQTLAHLRVYLAARLNEEELLSEPPIKLSLFTRLKQYLSDTVSAIGASFAQPPISQRLMQVEPVKAQYWSSDDIGFQNLATRLRTKLLQEMEAKNILRLPSSRNHVEQLIEEFLAASKIQLSGTTQQRLVKSLVSDVLGLGPLESLMEDDTISEIMVIGPKHIFIERAGHFTRAPVQFDDEKHMLQIIDLILIPFERYVDEASPVAYARLADGSRVNVAVRPVALQGPNITIRKFPKKPWDVIDLLRSGSMTHETVEFLRACLLARLNILVTGSESSGKTTFINVMSGFIPNEEHIVDIEPIAELQLQHGLYTVLEADERTTYQELVENATRMRAERLIFGDVKGSEAFSVLQALSMGYGGSMLELRAPNTRDSLIRLQVLCQLANIPLSDEILRELIASVIDVIAVQQKMLDGSRRLVEVVELQGVEKGVFKLATIFAFRQTDIQDGKIMDRIRPTGIIPNFTERIESLGIKLPPSVFGNYDSYWSIIDDDEQA